MTSYCARLNRYSSTPKTCLLGLVHGHFYEEGVTAVAKPEETESALAPETRVKLNTGIAIVVPIQRVLETIELVESRPGMKRVQVIRSNSSPTTETAE